MNFISSLFSESPKDKSITGSPHQMARYISADIHNLRVKIKLYGESTGPSPLFRHLYELLEADHSRNVSNLQRKHNHNVAESNKAYHRELVTLKKHYANELSGFLDLMTNHHTKAKVQTVFAARDETTSISDLASSAEENAPDWILDPISFSILQDPVVTPCGITYEKAPLMEYLQHNGYKDPITKKPLLRENIVPNLALKDVVSDYLVKM